MSSPSPPSGPFLVTSPNTVVSWPRQLATDRHLERGGHRRCAGQLRQRQHPALNRRRVHLARSCWPPGHPTTAPSRSTCRRSTTTPARVKVEAAANIFFDISNLNFEITLVDPADVAARRLAGLALLANRPNPFRARDDDQLPACRRPGTVDPARLRSGGTAACARSSTARSRPAAQQAIWDGTDAERQGGELRHLPLQAARPGPDPHGADDDHPLSPARPTAR